MCTDSRAQKQKAHKSALRVIISKLEVNRVVGLHCFRCGSHLVSLSSVYKCWSGRNLRCVFIHVYRVNCYLSFYFFFYGRNQRQKRRLAYLKDFDVTKPAYKMFVNAFVEAVTMRVGCYLC